MNAQRAGNEDFLGNSVEELKQMSQVAGSDDKTNLQIPSALASRIQKRLAKSDFKSIDEYASYILDQVLSELEAGEAHDEKQTQNEGTSVFSKEDQESVEQRLRDLGYL